MPARLPFRVLGVIALAAAVTASVLVSAQQPPHWPWVQAYGLVVFAIASGALLFAALPSGPAAALLAAAGVAVVAVYWAQPVGVPIGMFVLAAVAASRTPLRPMLAVLGGIALLFCTVQLTTGHESVATAAAILAGMAFFAGVGTLLVAERRQRERSAALLTQLESARAAERAVAAVATRAAAAREVHDVLAHSLSGLIIQLEAARLQAKASPASPALQESVDNALRSARSGLTEAKRAVAALRGERSPGAADVPALIEEHRLTTGAPTVFEIAGLPRSLSPEAGLALYRAAQESLSNIRKHAPGAPAAVRIVWGHDDVTLVTRNPAPSGQSDSAGWGLAGIGERVAALGGGMRAGREGSGDYLVEVVIPIPADVRAGPRE